MQVCNRCWNWRVDVSEFGAGHDWVYIDWESKEQLYAIQHLLLFEYGPRKT